MTKGNIIYKISDIENFEVLVGRDTNDNMYEGLTPSGNGYFLEGRFFTTEELLYFHLHKEFGLIKQLRYSEYQ